jgi:hypothetical protein
MRQVLIALCSISLLAGCVKEISSEERLDRATNFAPIKDAPGAAELAKLSCADTTAELTKARDVNRNETDRVMGYFEVYESLKKKTASFEEAMTRNPDLAYREGSQAFVDAKEVCVQQTADVKVEFEQYVRDLVKVPTVQEIKGGATVVVARLDFNTLRQAIDSLSLEDKDALMNQVNAAEKKIAASREEEPTPRRRR